MPNYLLTNVVPIGGPSSEVYKRRPWTANHVNGTGGPTDFFSMSVIYPNAGWTTGPFIGGKPTFYITLQHPNDSELEYTFAYTTN